MTTLRCRSGKRSISWCRMSARSSGIALSVHPALSSAARCSASLRRFTSRRAWLAARMATRWSHGAIESRTQSEPGLAHQHQKRRLEGVRRLVLVAQHGPAGAPDQGPMPLDQRGERRLGRLAVAQGEPLQQLPIGDPDERAGVEERLQAARDGPGSVRWHD